MNCRAVFDDLPTRLRRPGRPSSIARADAIAVTREPRASSPAVPSPCHSQHGASGLRRSTTDTHGPLTSAASSRGARPLCREEVETLLQSRGGAPLSPAVTEAIVTRSEGNPFFVEELLAAAGQGRVDLPHVLRDLLLQRVAQLDRQTQGVLRVAAAAGRDVPYPLLRTVADAPEGELRQALRSAVDHGVLVGDQAAGTFRSGTRCWPRRST
jgi:hypothetical protein